MRVNVNVQCEGAVGHLLYPQIGHPKIRPSIAPLNCFLLGEESLDGKPSDTFHTATWRVTRHVREAVAQHFEQKNGASVLVPNTGRRLCALGLKVPTWDQLANGRRPSHNSQGEREPGEPRHGWQKVAAEVVHTCHRAQAFSTLSKPQRALLRSQSALASVPFTALPVHRVSRIDSELHRILLLRRLWLQLPFAQRTCLCGRRLDSLGHHSAARQQEFWAGEVIQSRVPSVRCAEKRGHASQRMS